MDEPATKLIEETDKFMRWWAEHYKVMSETDIRSEKMLPLYVAWKATQESK